MPPNRLRLVLWKRLVTIVAYNNTVRGVHDDGVTLTRSTCAFFPVILPRYVYSIWKDAISASELGVRSKSGILLELYAMSTAGI